MTVEPVTEFDQWYTDRSVNTRTGALEFRNTTPCAQRLVAKFESFKHEMDARLANYWKLEMLADGEVLSKQKDLPNVSSGETAGMVRRIARNVVQNTPNVEVISKFDDDSAEGIFVRHMLLEKIIGSDNYSNDMQQNLFASTISSCTLGFDCVVPVLLQHPAGDWYIKYDTIHYRDVFPEPGVKDVRQSQEVFIRRYLTKGDIRALIQAQTQGWDIPALRRLAEIPPELGEARELLLVPRVAVGVGPRERRECLGVVTRSVPRRPRVRDGRAAAGRPRPAPRVVHAGPADRGAGVAGLDGDRCHPRLGRRFRARHGRPGRGPRP